MSKGPNEERSPSAFGNLALWPFGTLPMTTEQLRQALRELNGKRDSVIYFVRAEKCIVTNAMLLPEEPDHLIKLTDGKHVYIIDAADVAWIKIG